MQNNNFANAVVVYSDDENSEGEEQVIDKQYPKKKNAEREKIVYKGKGKAAFKTPVDEEDFSAFSVVAGFLESRNSGGAQKYAFQPGMTIKHDLSFLNTENGNTDWIIDSGASIHVIFYKYKKVC